MRDSNPLKWKPTTGKSFASMDIKKLCSKKNFPIACYFDPRSGPESALIHIFYRQGGALNVKLDEITVVTEYRRITEMALGEIILWRNKILIATVAS